MPRFSPDELLKALQSDAIAADASLCVAYSGGLDSTVLLHALARVVRVSSAHRLRAIHIDHQLHHDSARWRAHCESTAAALGVPIVHLTVHVQHAGEGLESAARRARYGALRARLQPEEILLTAHHADDQLETVLLALVRGAGVNGLSGIASIQPFGPGRLARPLLAFTRVELASWAEAEGIEWIEDPSNEDTDLDRNYLRRRVLPALRDRWPAAAPSATRSASHLAEAAQMLASAAHADMAQCAVGPCLDVAQLAAFDPARRRNLLRYWIRQRGARAPSTRKLAAIEHDLLPAGIDRTPCVDWDDVEVRRYRGLLYLDQRLPEFESSAALVWDTGSPIELPANLGRLLLQPDPSGALSAAKLSSTLFVRFRAGGEMLRPAGDAHRRSLKKLLQSSGVPPWRRDRLPLIYSDDRLVAVGDLWISDEFAARDDASANVIWQKEGPASGKNVSENSL
ncbi:MAG: tRNA lysidine(34) synthetase TilS [Steroidobacter sp.]